MRRQLIMITGILCILINFGCKKEPIIKTPSPIPVHFAIRPIMEVDSVNFIFNQDYLIHGVKVRIESLSFYIGSTIEGQIPIVFSEETSFNGVLSEVHFASYELEDGCLWFRSFIETCEDVPEVGYSNCETDIFDIIHFEGKIDTDSDSILETNIRFSVHSVKIELEEKCFMIDPNFLLVTLNLDIYKLFNGVSILNLTEEEEQKNLVKNLGYALTQQ